MRKFKARLTEMTVYEAEVEARDEDEAYERWLDLDQDDLPIADSETVSIEIEEAQR